MTFYNKQGDVSMTNSVDIIANSISLIQPDGTLQALTVGGTSVPVNNPTTKEDDIAQLQEHGVIRLFRDVLLIE